MKKIAFIGAGSFIFTRNLVRDVLTFPAFRDCHIALVNTDPRKLDFARRSVNRIVGEGDYPATVTATTDRSEVLPGADAVIVTISLTGSSQRWSDLQIPLRYGVDINVGDTRGPAGVFRMLRTLPAMLDICRDVARLCPDAVVLNYTNPMSTLCRAMQEAFPDLKTVGLCHSVQGIAGMLAYWIGAPCDEMAVRGALDKDPTAIFHAIAYDPLTSAVCSLSEIKDMVGDLFRANTDCVAGFKPL